jgi:drug/metabolite transporter (DMT)-like permease
MKEGSRFARGPEIALAVVTFLWGSTFIVTKGVLRESAPLPYLTIRFGLAALILLALHPRALRAPRRTLVDGAVLAVGQTLGLLIQVFAQVYTTASKAAFITALCTVLTPVVGYVLYRERPRGQQVIGVALAGAGVAFLTWPGGASAWNRGDLLCLACALVYAWVIVETARRARGADVAALTTVQTAACALLIAATLAGARLLLAWLPEDAAPELLLVEKLPFHLGAPLVARILYMAVFCTVATFLAQMWAMGRMSATQAAVVFALEPLFATGLAIAVEGSAEWPGSRGVLGAALILAGLFAAEARITREETYKEAPERRMQGGD